MGKLLNVFNKYVKGSECCTLEGEEGIGCLRDCPYSYHGNETPTCKQELETDGDALKHVIFEVESFIEEAGGIGC